MRSSASTMTAEGLIPHARVPGVGLCPVALETKQTPRGRRLVVGREAGRPAPERDARGRLMYVLPGGGRWCAR